MHMQLHEPPRCPALSFAYASLSLPRSCGRRTASSTPLARSAPRPSLRKTAAGSNTPRSLQVSAGLAPQPPPSPVRRPGSAAVGGALAKVRPLAPPAPPRPVRARRRRRSTCLISIERQGPPPALHAQAGPTPAVSWRKQSRKRPRCPFVSYKPPAAPPSEGTRRGGAVRPEEAAEEGPFAAPGSPRRSGPLGPHACQPASPEPQVRGRRGAPLRAGDGRDAGAMCERGWEAGVGGAPAPGPTGVTAGTGSRAGRA